MIYQIYYFFYIYNNNSVTPKNMSADWTSPPHSLCVAVGGTYGRSPAPPKPPQCGRWRRWPGSDRCRRPPRWHCIWWGGSVTTQCAETSAASWQCARPAGWTTPASPARRWLKDREDAWFFSQFPVLHLPRKIAILWSKPRRATWTFSFFLFLLFTMDCSRWSYLPVSLSPSHLEWKATQTCSFSWHLMLSFGDVLVPIGTRAAKMQLVAFCYPIWQLKKNDWK